MFVHSVLAVQYRYATRPLIRLRGMHVHEGTFEDTKSTNLQMDAKFTN
jgi:hypothetical protein